MYMKEVSEGAEETIRGQQATGRFLFSLGKPLPSGLGVFAALGLCGDLYHASFPRHVSRQTSHTLLMNPSKTVLSSRKKSL